jgi:hypothetical protein
MTPNRHYMIEEFLIIGEDISMNRLELLEDDEKIYADSKNMHMFREPVNVSKCTKRDAVRQFCFPRGVLIKRLNKLEVSQYLKE